MVNQKEFQEQYLGTFEMPKQSERLTQFYRAYAAWVDDGAPFIPVFTRNSGLCRNLRLWSRAIGLGNQIIFDLSNEMRNQFLAARRNDSYPFDGHPLAYERDKAEQKLHLNEHRIKWVREHAAI